MMFVILSFGAIAVLISLIAAAAAVSGRLRDGRPHVTVVEEDADGIIEVHRK